jgi:membrane associated rhomboid family serine protease
MLPLTDTIRSRSFPLVNWLIILANVLVFVVFEVPLDPRALDRFVRLWGLVPAELFSGSPLAVATLFSSMFLHGGWLHLLGNMLYLYIFGDNVEDVLGPGLYFLFYMVSGLVATLVQVFVYPDSPIPTLGASGAIAGVLGAYVVLYPNARIRTLFWLVFLIQTIALPALVVLGAWFIFQFFQGYLAMESPLASGGVAYFAHVGGFLAGMALIVVLPRRRR